MQYKYDQNDTLINRLTLDGEYGVYKEHKTFTFETCNSEILNNDQHLKLRYTSNLTSSFTVTDDIFNNDNLNVEL